MLKKLIAAAFLVVLSLPAIAQSISSAPSPVYSLSTTGAFKSGRFYGPTTFSAPAGAAVASANTLYAVPFFVPATSVAKTMLFDITSGNAAAWNAEMCIYQDNGTFGPGALVPNADTGTVAIGSGSITGVQSGTLNSSNGVTLGGPAWYWLVFEASSASESIMQHSGIDAYSEAMFGDSVNTGIFNGVGTFAYTMAQSFGACPATYAGAINRNAVGPYIILGF